MLHLGELHCFRSLEAGVVSLGVPVVDGAVQTHYFGPPSKASHERLAVDIQREPATSSPGLVSISREDGSKLQVCSHYEVPEEGAHARTSLYLFAEPIPELTFVRSPEGIWTTREEVTTEENTNHLKGLAGLIGLYALNKQSIRMLR